MTSIRDGYPTSMKSMSASMSSCNSCGNATCENLAKLVAHAWLKANNVPETGGTTAHQKQLHVPTHQAVWMRPIK